jgi:hypothetical protein
MNVSDEDHTIDVLAICGGVGTSRVANADAVFRDTHEVGPFVDLLWLYENREREK